MLNILCALTLILVIGSSPGDTTTKNLETIETSVAVFNSPYSDEEAHKLENRGPRVYEYTDCGSRCPGQGGTSATEKEAQVVATQKVRFSNNKCKFGKNGTCPPLVCNSGSCKYNYAVIFASKSCVVCPRMWPVVAKLRKDGYLVFYVDTGKYPGLLVYFDIKVWPTTIVMEGGKQKAKFTGVTMAPNIMKYLKTRKQQGIKPRTTQDYDNFTK